VKKRIFSITLAFALLISPVLAAAGGADDPLVSFSWLYETWLPELSLRFTDLRMSRLDEAAVEYGSRLDDICFFPKSSSVYQLADIYASAEMEDGGNVTLDAFASYVQRNGCAYLTEVQGEILDLTDGHICQLGEQLQEGHRYFAAEDSRCVIKSYANGTSGMVSGYYLVRNTGDFLLNEQFLDIGSHWAKQYIEQLMKRGIVNGTSAHTFAPNQQVTRGMFVTVLGRLYGSDIRSGENAGFTDVKPEDWFAPYVEWASRSGIVKGYDDSTFRPNAVITREQMALILVRFCDIYGYQLPETAGDSVFMDADKISSWAGDAVERARSWGLISGKGNGIFDPKGTTTRAEMCAVICRLAEAAGLQQEGDSGAESN